MKCSIFTIILLFSLLFTGTAQNIGFNDNNSDPNPSAMVDIFSANKGFLIPRVGLESTILSAPVTNPAVSLLVYNTATINDVTPGYYYWNGSMWVHLKSSMDQAIYFAPAIKTSDATLLKTETMILASGNITLTLPAVTAADNGLEIVIKNAGLHTDLVVIKPEEGKKIDASDSSKLTRWDGRVYLAYNSNWVLKYKESLADNLLDVSATGSFTSIQEVVEFLDVHMFAPTVVRLGGGNYTIPETITIDLPFPVTFQGLSFGETIIECPAGSTAFNAISESYFKMLVFYGGDTAGVAINLSGPETYYEVKDGYFYGFSKAIVISNSADLWLFEVDFDSCTVAGAEIDGGAANDVVFRISECDFYNCASGIHLKSGGPNTEVSILNATFYNFETNQVGITYVPSTGIDNFRFSSLIVQNNSFNNVGSFYSGFDFSRADGRDADVFMENNAGKESMAPHCKVNVTNNIATTSISGVNTWTKASDFTAYASYTTKWTIHNNRITYQSENVRDGIAFISGNIRCNNSARVLHIALVKNGNSSIRYGETTVRITPNSANQSFGWSTNVYLEEVKKDDYFEIWVTSENSGDILTIDDMNWFTDTH